MTDRRLVVFRTAEAGERPPVPGWEIRSVVLGEQIPLPRATETLLDRLEGRDCLLVTSPRAAKWLAELDLPPGKRLPVFVAGSQTGSLPLEAGWDVRVAATPGGEAATRLLHAHGFRKPLFPGASETAGTVEAAAAELGLDLVHLAVYATKPRRNLSQDELPPIEATDFVAFLAPSAVRFLQALASSHFAALSVRVPAAVAGEATRQALLETGWRDIRLAPRPDIPSLIRTLEDP